MPLIFISHAAADKPVVDDFFDLLQTGCDVRRSEIFCSSVEGAGIETGQDFIKWIYGKMVKCKLVVLFLTPNYFASRFCVSEMGASWALKKDVFPLLIPGMKRDAGAVMLGKHTALVDESGLDNLRDHITEHYPDAGKSTARWSLQRDKFLKKFRDKLKKLPSPKLVDQALLKEEKNKTSAAMEMNDELTEQVRKLREQVEKLEKAKDAEEVAKIKTEFKDEDERYDELVKQAKIFLNKLSAVEARCVYASIRDESWHPSQFDNIDENKSIQKAVQSDTIYEQGDDSEGYTYEANLSHPRLKKAWDALNDLDDFIREKLSEEAIDNMVNDRGYYIAIRNREYWNEELDQTYMPD